MDLQRVNLFKGNSSNARRVENSSGSKINRQLESLDH